MFNNQNFKVASVERCVLSSEERKITDRTFEVYIPRLMPKIEFAPPKTEEEETGVNDLLENELSGVKATITSANHLRVKSMTDYRTWYFGQIYKMSHSNGQTQTEIHPDRDGWKEPIFPEREIAGPDDNYINTSYIDGNMNILECPFDINGVKRPVSNLGEWLEIPMVPGLIQGHAGPPHLEHAHPINKPFQFFNVKYEELNNIYVEHGHKMVGVFVSGDLNDFRITHIEGVIPQDGEEFGNPDEDYDPSEISESIRYSTTASGELPEGVVTPDDPTYESYGVTSGNPVIPLDEYDYDPPEEDEEEVEKMTDETMNIVAIDAGHGGSDPGATGHPPLPAELDLHEADVTLSISNRVRRLLENRGYTVIMTRPGNTYVSPNERGRIAARNNADIMVSIHINAYDDPSAHGTETLYQPTMGLGKALANYIQNNFIERLDSRNRGLKSRSDLGVLNECMRNGIPAALTETGFITNETENNLLRTEEFQNTIAESIADGINTYYATHT